MHVSEPVVQDCDLGSRRLERDTIGQSRKQSQRSAAAVGSSWTKVEGYPQLGLSLPERREVKRLRHHGDNRVLFAVQLNALADDGAVAAEAPCPQRVPDDDEMSIAAAIIR